MSTSGQNHNDPGLHLFVDDAEIERTERLSRVVNRLRKHPDPVLVADRPWEGERAQAWGSVVQEPDGLLRLWYFAFNTERKEDELDRGGYAYAESRDGIRWEKPHLGVVEFRGSTDNNLFYTCAPDSKNLVDIELARRGLGLPAIDKSGNEIGVLNNLDGLTVLRDDHDPDPQRRYKLIANMQDHRMWRHARPEHYKNVTAEQEQQARHVFGQYMDTSPDGIHWTRRPQNIVQGAVGDYMMVMRDHRNRRWWLNERAHGGKGKGRNAALRTSDNLRDWSEPRIVFDNLEDSEFGQAFEWHGGFTPFNYGNLNLGLLEKWPNYGFGGTCELVCNRGDDPFAWQRVAPGTPFLDIGPDGAFDRVLAFPTHNAPARIGDTLYIFYTGGGVRTNPNQGVPMSIGLATIPVDRFAGLACWRSVSGLLVTKPLDVLQPHLQVNLESLELQSNPGPCVALFWPDGSPIAGFGFDECSLDYSHNRVYSPVRWTEKADLSELIGKSVVLQFQLPGCCLYSCRFAPQNATRPAS